MKKMPRRTGGKPDHPVGLLERQRFFLRLAVPPRTGRNDEALYLLPGKPGALHVAENTQANASLNKPG
jgi:hypothetical protein